MPGRRTPSHRGGTPIGGDTPAAVGSLVLSDPAKLFSVYAGDVATVFNDTDDIITLSNGGPGNWRNPQYSIAYSDVEDWLTFQIANVVGTFQFTPVIDATSLTESTQVATITVTDTHVSNSPQTFTVTALVSAVSPAMALNPPTVSVSIVDETAAGTAKTSILSNANGLGTLAVPTIGTITGAGAAYIDNVAVTGTSPGPYTITITPTATGGTVGGPYQAVIPVSSSGASNSPLNLLCDVTVIAAQGAVIALYRSLDDAQFTVGGANPSAQATGFYNVGTGTFAGVTIDSTSYRGDFSDWATPSITNGILTVDIDVSSVAVEGYAYADVVLSDANAAATATYTVIIKSSLATPQPELSVSPSAIGFTVDNGTNGADRFVQVQNVNGNLSQLGTLGANITPGVSWVTASAIVNGQITLTFQTDTLANATYNTALVISSSTATNSPISVPISVTVQAPPTPGTYVAPAWTLPTGASFDTNTDEITYDPFSSPADPTGFA